jgi:heme oxygenase
MLAEVVFAVVTAGAGLGALYLAYLLGDHNGYSRGWGNGYAAGIDAGRSLQQQDFDSQLMKLQMEQRQQAFSPPVILPFEDRTKGV